jgi:hypothetical protein
VRLAALALVALALTACESNQERSAKLERAAETYKGEAARRRALAQRALTITRVSKKIEIVSTDIVRGREGDAAIVTLRNTSNTTLSDVPVQINVRNARGTSLYTNDIPGLSPTLASVALIPAHTVLTWIDDQVQASGLPVSVSAKVGEGTPSPNAAAPELSVQGAHLAEGETEGSVVNHSQVSQQELVVNALARRAGKIVAAGRAVLPAASAGAATPFQIFFVGSPTGAQLEVSAPATTPG